VIAIRSTLSGDWYEALEYHWLALFNMVSWQKNSFCMPTCILHLLMNGEAHEPFRTSQFYTTPLQCFP
jgi:hypothetical protein